MAAGDFDIALSTPRFDYRELEQERLRAERTQRERNKKQQNAGENQRDSDTPKAREQEAGTHPAVLTIRNTIGAAVYARSIHFRVIQNGVLR